MKNPGSPAQKWPKAEGGVAGKNSRHMETDREFPFWRYYWGKRGLTKRDDINKARARFLATASEEENNLIEIEKEQFFNKNKKNKMSSETEPVSPKPRSDNAEIIWSQDSSEEDAEKTTASLEASPLDESQGSLPTALDLAMKRAEQIQSDNAHKEEDEAKRLELLERIKEMSKTEAADRVGRVETPDSAETLTEENSVEAGPESQETKSDLGVGQIGFAGEKAKEFVGTSYEVASDAAKFLGNTRAGKEFRIYLGRKKLQYLDKQVAKQEAGARSAEERANYYRQKSETAWFAFRRRNFARKEMVWKNRYDQENARLSRLQERHSEVKARINEIIDGITSRFREKLAPINEKLGQLEREYSLLEGQILAEEKRQEELRKKLLSLDSELRRSSFFSWFGLGNTEIKREMRKVKEELDDLTNKLADNRYRFNAINPEIKELKRVSNAWQEKISNQDKRVAK